MNIDIRPWAKTNCWLTPSGELCTRPGLRRVYSPDSGKVLVGGFSVLNQYTNETWHYIFDIADSGAKGLRLQILTDDFEVFQVFTIGADVDPRAIGKAVIEGEIVIGSPDFPTIWGLVGSGVRFATKVSSTNPTTTAIDVPRGLVCRVLNRVIVALGPTLWISDPVAVTGGSPRTFTAVNQNNRASPIFGIHEGAGGMLVVCTADGVYGLDAGAFAVGSVGSNGADWRILSHHRTTSYESTAAIKGRIYGLTAGGYQLIDVENETEEALADPVMSRSQLAAIYEDDFRAARMFSSDLGPLVAIGDRLSVHDIGMQFRSWWTSAYSASNFKVRGVLQGHDSTEMLLCENGVFQVVGNFDGAQALSATGTATAIVMGQVPTAPMQAPVVRHVHWAVATGGAVGITAAVGGVSASATPSASVRGLVIGTSSWGASGRNWISTPMQSRRLDFDAAGDDVAIELACAQGNARFSSSVDVEFSKSSPVRSTDRGGA